MKAYTLSRRADRQLVSTYAYSEQHFGSAQANRYLRGLAAVFDLLATNGAMGRAADAIRPGLRRHEHAAHVIFYRRNDDGVLIVAIRHRRMLPDLRLDDFDA